MSDAGPSSARMGLVAAGAIVLLASARLAFVLAAVGFIGWDTFPLIELNRTGSFADLLAISGRPLMGPDGPGLYYRPVLSILFAIDFWLWGLWEPGYHLTTLLVFAGAALAVYRLAGHLLAPGALLASLVALVFFVSHPVHATVLTMPARRADLLCVLFMATALAEQAGRGTRPHGWSGRVAAFTALALLSKESAFVLPILLWVVAFVFSSTTSLPKRAYQAAVRVAPAFAVVAIIIAVRVLVLGALVGERPVLESGFAHAAWDMLLKVLRGTLAWGSAAGTTGGPIVAAGVFLLGAALANVLAGPVMRRQSISADLRCAAVGVVWLTAVTVLFAIGLILPPWYIVNPAVPIALLLAAGARSVLVLAREPGSRVPAYVALAALVVVCGISASRSPLLRGVPRWVEAADVQRQFLDSLDRDLSAARDGTVVATTKLPMMFPRAPGGSKLGGIAMLAGYSVQSWTELAFPDRRIRVEYGRDVDLVPLADEVVVHLSGRRTPAAPSVPRQGR